SGLENSAVTAVDSAAGFAGSLNFAATSIVAVADFAATGCFEIAAVVSIVVPAFSTSHRQDKFSIPIQPALLPPERCWKYKIARHC
ncbi:MAG TPA: hypothetical protein VHY30_10855, partial [Verrucomicrobiae bacterium]|nr:hypothetical protein [Verrucomicrobiae bacterium]